MVWQKICLFFKETRTKNLYPAIKEQGSKTDHWPPFDVCVKNTRNSTETSTSTSNVLAKTASPIPL